MGLCLHNIVRSPTIGTVIVGILAVICGPVVIASFGYVQFIETDGRWLPKYLASTPAEIVVDAVVTVLVVLTAIYVMNLWREIVCKK